MEQFTATLKRLAFLFVLPTLTGCARIAESNPNSAFGEAIVGTFKALSTDHASNRVRSNGYWR